MDMDPMTRREAEKVEAILADLIDELRLISLLPEEFSSWVRDETVVAASSEASEHYRQLYDAHVARTRAAEAKRSTKSAAPLSPSSAAARGHARAEADNIDGANADGDGLCHAESSGSTEWAARHPAGGGAADRIDFSALEPEEEEERQRAIKAACFLHAAAQYGDPRDYDGNEAALQVGDVAVLERDLIYGATNSGAVAQSDLTLHHLSTRALIDTLRDGGYMAGLGYFIEKLYPTSRAARRVRGVKAPEEKGTVDIAQMHVYGSGMVEEGVDHLRELVETLHRLIHERNQSTVNEDIHRYQLLHDAVNKDQAGTADVQVLNQRFLDVKAARRAEVAELDQHIAQLEEELQYVQQAADVELEAYQRVQETIQADHRSTLRQQLDAHRSAADAIAKKLQQAQTKDLDELTKVRTNRIKREAAVSGAIADYDTQSALLEAAMRQSNAEAEADTERVVRLEAEVQALQKQKEEHEWEVTVAGQRQEHAKVIRERQEADARVIQAYYRAFRACQQAQQAQEKGGKKGKKKGGGKK